MSRSILVIEDNERNLYLVQFLLEGAGYTVLTAKDGRAGVALAAESRPGLVLLDIQLPEMDGYAVARELRQNQDLSGIPIIAVTSYAMPGDRERALDAGCTGYIEKPIDPETFVSNVEGYLAQRTVG